MKTYDLHEELKEFCELRGIWNEEEERPTRYVTNKTRNVTVKHPDGYTYQRTVQDGFTTKRIKFETCLYCHTELTGKQKKFCTSRCSDLRHKLEKKRIELGAEGIWITKVSEFPQWKDMTVTYRGEKNELFTDYDDGVTKKSGKGRNQDY